MDDLVARVSTPKDAYKAGLYRAAWSPFLPKNQVNAHGFITSIEVPTQLNKFYVAGKITTYVIVAAGAYSIGSAILKTLM